MILSNNVFHCSAIGSILKRSISITLFMKKGEAQGAVVKNGLEMLLLQAFAAWEIWNR